MDKPTIALIRYTNIVSNDQAMDFAQAAQTQLDRDFEPIWHVGANIVTVGPGEGIPAGAWGCLLMDNSDQADALGYHEVTAEGLPIMKVFCADDRDAGLQWSVTASHEILETLADPDIQQTVKANINGVVYEYAREVCDAPEDDKFSYKIGDLRVSAFVTPAWFDLSGLAPFSFPVIPAIDGPFKLADGGYIGYREISPDPTGWTQRFARGLRGKRSVKSDLSRTRRRFNANP